ncbi:hypothetical protein IWW54_007132, partial [Coemansia sp. RSA 2705]
MPDATSPWDGVRNYQARNHIRNMKIGDKVLFYHSNCKIPGIVGVASVVKEAYPDHTAFDPAHMYYDSKSNQDVPRWYMVDIKFERKFDHILSLSSLKQHIELNEMALFKQARLSVQPVRTAEF